MSAGDDDDNDHNDDETDTEAGADNDQSWQLTSPHQLDLRGAGAILIAGTATELSQESVHHILDQDHTLDSVTINGVQDAEVRVVRKNDLSIVTPGQSKRLGITCPHVASNSGRLSNMGKLLWVVSSHVRRSTSFDLK